MHAGRQIPITSTKYTFEFTKPLFGMAVFLKTFQEGALSCDKPPGVAVFLLTGNNF